MTMRDLIDKLKGRPKTVEEHWEQQKREWLRALDTFFEQVEAWLGPAVGEGVLRTRRSETEIIEQDLGEYQAPTLEIRDGRLTVRLEPIGARVAGFISSDGRLPVGLRGRVDLVCGPTRLPLMRTSTGAWAALPLRGEPREMTEESFAQLLGEVLLGGCRGIRARARARARVSCPFSGRNCESGQGTRARARARARGLFFFPTGS
jgi:hypothetical protein